ncbi:TetR/AcrR family transcriptional regulator [Pseudonocardia sp. TMWB2A]|uniref:TetR/AcrR family transcriptional regulator n=1 Tax=unclassified Pseudonocardia TaxID=2619320 RepID=UPI001CF6E3D6|nr:TetR/AcrR family transcriptional regulator [Pseudonocardia sp. ICBG162]
MARKTNAVAPAEPDGTDSSDSKSARTRARLLDAAAQVLSQKGFAGTRLSDIAQVAKIQAPAIYYYYPSREDLIEDVVATGAASMREHLTAVLGALPDGTPPADRLAAAVEAQLRHELQLSDYARAVVRNANQLPEHLSARAREQIAEYHEIWRGLIEDLRAAGQLRPDVDPSIGRMLIMGSLNWTVEWWDPERGEIDRTIAVAQSMILYSLRP